MASLGKRIGSASLAFGLFVAASAGPVAAGTHADPEANRMPIVIPPTFVDRVYGWLYDLDEIMRFNANNEDPAAADAEAGTPGAEPPAVPDAGRGAARALATPLKAGLYRVDNAGFDLDAGEPNPGGAMTRTAWRGYKASETGRMVVASYGSNRFGAALDTLVAAYRVDGSGASAKLVRLAYADNRPLDGIDRRNAVVAFDVVAGQYYAFQIGTRAQAEGTLAISAAVLPPGGGLSLLAVGDAYRCDVTVGTSAATCPAPSFILHNSSTRPLQVRATSTFGASVVPPAPFMLPAGGVVRKRFAVSGSFSTTSRRAVAGRFIFTGRASGVVVAQAAARGVVTVHEAEDQTDLTIAAFQQIYAAETGRAFVAPLAIYNNGSVPAVGCTIAQDISVPAGTYQSSWLAYSRPAGKPLGVFQPFNIPAKGAVDVLVGLRLLRDNLADLEFGRSLVVNCANARVFPPAAEFDATSRFDVTGTFRRRVALRWLGTPPATGTLVVPAGGTVFRGIFLNREVPGSVVARVAAAEGASGFMVSVCSVATSDAACLASTVTELPLTLRARQKFSLKVAVKPTGTTTPGAAILTVFEAGTAPEVPVGGTMKAIRGQ